MSKTSPIVIPVTVDTTGVDRGLNNVRSRLTRGGGRGTGGGFGTGGNNSNGVGQGGSGGGVLSAAVAAGVASNITGRQVGQQVGRSVQRTQKQMLARLEAMGINAQVRVQPAGLDVIGKWERAGERRNMELADLYDIRMERLRQRSLRGRLGAFGKEMFGDTKMRQEFLKNMFSRAGIPEFAGARLAAGLGGVGGMVGIGAGAALMGGAGASRFLQGQYNRFANFEQYEGTEFYGIARRNAMRYNKSDGMNWYDKMMLREKEAGGAFSTVIEGIGRGFNIVSELTGAALGSGGQGSVGLAAQARNIIFGNITRIAN